MSDITMHDCSLVTNQCPECNFCLICGHADDCDQERIDREADAIDHAMEYLRDKW